MKILSLNLKAYGPFTDQTLEISSETSGLTVVYGPNEAGKSSALRAIHDMLFGIPVKTPDNFRHQYKHMRVGGSLSANGSSRFEFLRRKGNSDTLRGPDDTKSASEADLERMLGGCTSDLFRSMFGISHETLRKGGREIAAGQGDVGELLFIAGGAVELRQHQQALAEEAKDYWSARKGIVRDQLSSLLNTRKELKKSSISVNDWKQQAGNLEVLQNEERQLNCQIEELDRTFAQRQRYKTAFASIPQWRLAVGKMEAIASAPRLSADFTKRRLAIEKALSLAQGQSEDAAVAIARVEKRLSELVVPESLLNANGQVESLVQRLEQYRSALRDRPLREQELRAAQQAANDILKNLGRTADGFQADDFQVPAATRKRIQEFARSHPHIAIRIQNAAKDLQKAIFEEDTQQQRRAGLPPLSDSRELRTVLNQCQDVISTSELSRRQRDQTQLARQSEIQLSQLRGWSGTLDELERIAPPTAVAIDRHEQSERQFASDLTRMQNSSRERSQRLRELTLELTTLERGIAIPTEETLQASRDNRESLWRKLQTLFSSRQAMLDESLVAEYRLAVDSADQLSDRMRREADLVAKKALLQVEQKAIKAELAGISAAESELVQKHAMAHAAWEALWSSVGVQGGSSAEMRTWLRQYGELIKLSGELRRLESELAHDTERQNSAVQELRLALTTSGLTELSDQATFEQCKASAAIRIEAIQELSNLTRSVTETLESAIKTRTGAEIELKAAQNELQEWQTGWAAQMQLLKRPDEMPPEEAVEELEQLKSFFDNLREADKLKERIAQISDFSTQFEQDVASVLSAVQQSPGDRAKDAIVLDLRREIASVQVANEQFKTDEQDLEELREKQRKAEQRRLDAVRQQEFLCAEAGCASVADLPIVEQAADEKRRIQEQIETLELSLLELSGGKPVQDFVKEIEGQDVDQLTSQVRLDEQTLKELRAQRDDVLQKIRQEQLTLERMSGGDQAARLAEECEFVAADLADNVRRLAVLRVTEAILRRGMEQHREHNQGPILARARALFSELTDGAMADLVADIDAGKHVVYGVRRGTQERLEISAMSEGTQDQLFLALRLASVEHWLEKHEPIPFIVDDILLTFDDARAVAALQVLGRLAVKTQVIFFTHHQHLVDLARQHLPKKNLQVQSLVPAL